MLLINVHQLDIVLAEAIGLRIFEGEIDNIRRIFSLEREDVLVLCSTKDFRERREIDAEGDVAVAAEGREGFGLEHHRDESDVGIVHRLKRDTGVIAVEVAVLYEIFDGVNNLEGKIRVISVRGDLSLPS